MNDKDKEAFNEWIKKTFDFSLTHETEKKFFLDDAEKGWEACLLYKQKEIDDLKNVTYWTVEQDGKVTRHISIAEIEKLKAELLEYKEAATSEADFVNELQAENERLSIIIDNQKTVININQAENSELNKWISDHQECFKLSLEREHNLKNENANLRNDIKEILTLSFYDLQGDDLEVLNGFKSEYLKELEDK